jgi:hypothetical protein
MHEATTWNDMDMWCVLCSMARDGLPYATVPSFRLTVSPYDLVIQLIMAVLCCITTPHPSSEPMWLVADPHSTSLQQNVAQ